VGQLRISNSQLILQKTKLGWIISGNIPLAKTKNAVADTVVCGFASNTRLEDQLERFWRIEEIDAPSKKYSNEELLCEEEFKATHQKDHDGRFIIGLSFQQSIDQLGESRATAAKRLQAVN